MLLDVTDTPAETEETTQTRFKNWSTNHVKATSPNLSRPATWLNADGDQMKKAEGCDKDGVASFSVCI